MMRMLSLAALILVVLFAWQQSPTTQAYEPPEGASNLEIYASARNLLRSGDEAEASRVLFWLWDHALEREPGSHPVRWGAARRLGELAEEHEPTRTALASRRDRLQEAVDAHPQNATLEQLRDWAVLNEAMQAEQRILDWWEKVKDEADKVPLSAVVAGMEPYLRPLLLEELRWREMAKLYPDPQEYLARRSETHQRVLGTYAGDEGVDMLPPEMRERTKRERVQRAWEGFRGDIAVVYASLLAADREREAAEVADLAAKADESTATMRLTLVDMAIGAGEGRPEHAKWIAEAERDPSLQERAERLREWLRENPKE